MSVRDSQERYRNLRESFDELRIQDKALFLVEATVSTLARGIEQAGETLADEMGDLFGGEEARRRRSSDAARPSSAERQAPHPRQKPRASTEEENEAKPPGE